MRSCEHAIGLAYTRRVAKKNLEFRAPAFALRELIGIVVSATLSCELDKVAFSVLMIGPESPDTSIICAAVASLSGTSMRHWRQCLPSAPCDRLRS